MLREIKINAILVLDIIGRPKEYLLETLRNIIKEIEKEKGVVVKRSDIKEPKEIKEANNFYTTFAEIEVETEEIFPLILLIFKYMPAHIEIIEPEDFVIKNNDFNDIFNEIIGRLHGYDEIARIMQVERDKLLQKIKELEEKTNNKTENKK